jgi:hypothetical protein
LVGLANHRKIGDHAVDPQVRAPVVELADERRLTREADRGRTLERGPRVTAWYVECETVVAELRVADAEGNRETVTVVTAQPCRDSGWPASRARVRASPRSASLSSGSAELQEPDPTPAP